MAWTTSAYLRARPIVWEIAAAQSKTVRYLLASLRRSIARSHPSFAFAFPLAALGALAPLLPPALTTLLLIGTGAALALFAVPAPPASTGRALPARKAPASADERRAPAAMHDYSASAIALAPAMPHPFALDPEDRTWTELMARVSHDLRTPLNAVIGFSELMALELFGPLGDRRYQDYAHHIRDSATELLKSAEDTLALTALIAAPSRRDIACACNLELLVEDAWAFVARTAGARAVGFAARIPAHLEVMAEPRALRQILVNILSESVARAAYGERVLLAAEAEGELIELAVSVSRERARAARKGGSLPICLARALLEMQGSSLIEVDGPSHRWQAVTVLDRAAQPDFFMERFSGYATDGVPVLVS